MDLLFFLWLQVMSSHITRSLQFCPLRRTINSPTDSFYRGHDNITHVRKARLLTTLETIWVSHCRCRCRCHCHELTDGWIDGWMSGLLDELTAGWVDWWMRWLFDEMTDGWDDWWTNCLMNGLTDGWIDWWKSCRMDELTDGWVDWWME